VSDQKTRQGAVTGTDRAAHRHGFVLSPPGTFSANKHRAFPTQGGQHIPDALIHQVPGGAGGQFGAGLKLTPVIGSRQLRQLLMQHPIRCLLHPPDSLQPAPALHQPLDGINGHCLLPGAGQRCIGRIVPPGSGDGSTRHTLLAICTGRPLLHAVLPFHRPPPHHAAEEFGRAFPQTTIIVSGGNKIIDTIPAEPAIVIATPRAPNPPRRY